MRAIADPGGKSALVRDHYLLGEQSFVYEMMGVLIDFTKLV